MSLYNIKYVRIQINSLFFPAVPIVLNGQKSAQPIDTLVFIDGVIFMSLIQVGAKTKFKY